MVPVPQITPSAGDFVRSSSMPWRCDCAAIASPPISDHVSASTRSFRFSRAVRRPRRCRFSTACEIASRFVSRLHPEGVVYVMEVGRGLLSEGEQGVAELHVGANLDWNRQDHTSGRCGHLVFDLHRLQHRDDLALSYPLVLSHENGHDGGGHRSDDGLHSLSLPSGHGPTRVRSARRLRAVAEPLIFGGCRSKYARRFSYRG